MTSRAVRTTIVIASVVVLLAVAWLSMNRVPAETAAAAAAVRSGGRPKPGRLVGASIWV